QGDVLGVAELGRGDLLALEVRGAVDGRLDDEGGTARRGAGDDLDGAAVGLAPRVDGGVGADVGGVDGTREQRLDRGRPGIERRRLEGDVRPEVLGEDA